MPPTGMTTGPAASSETILRKAGRLEEYMNSRVRLTLNSWIVSSARYEHIAEVPLTKPMVFAALEKVIRSNAALVACLRRRLSEHVWLRLPSVDLNKVVEFIDKDSDVLDVVLEDLYTRQMEFADDVPLWKLLVFRDGTLVFTYDHTMGDGQSGVALHVAFLDALNTIKEPPVEHTGPVSVLSGDTALTPPVEDALDTSVPFFTVVWAMMKMILPSIDRKPLSAWTGHPNAKSVILETSVRIVHYTAEDTAALVRLSRAHNATLTGTLHTVALVVLSRLIRAQADASTFKTVSTSIPISLRRYTGAPVTAFCNHVSSYHAYHPLLPSAGKQDGSAFPWIAATDLVEALKREAPRSAPVVGMLKFLGGKYDGYLLGQLGRKRSTGLELSNLGPFPSRPFTSSSTTDASAKKAGSETRDGEGAHAWRIREMLFVQADSTLGPALKVNAVGTPSGGLGITVTWGKGAVDDAFAEEFVKGFKEGIRDLVVAGKA